jgi:hypothetical protein
MKINFGRKHPTLHLDFEAKVSHNLPICLYYYLFLCFLILCLFVCLFVTLVFCLGCRIILFSRIIASTLAIYTKGRYMTYATETVLLHDLKG